MTDLARVGFNADTSGLLKAQRELGNLANKGEQTERRLDRSIDNTNKSFMSLKNSVGVVGTALAALGSAALTRDLVKYSDTWKNVNSQIRQVTDSERELLAVRERVVQTAKDTRTDLEATTKLYATLDRATTRLGVSTDKQIELTKTINNLFLSSGASAQEASGAIRQLSQGLESGALRGDEFNSVAENAPRILDALAKSTGIARGELRDFAATGGITAEVLVKALSGYRAEAQKLADQTEKTFGQNMEIATTNITAFVGELDSVNAIVGSVGGGIVSLTDDLDIFAQEMEAWTNQFNGMGESIETSMSQAGGTFRKEIIALGAITDETIKFITDAIKHFPSNIKAIIEILAVELGAGIDVAVTLGSAFVKIISANLSSLVDIAKTRAGAFGDVLGVQLATIVEKAKIYGKQIADALNPFDGDTFDHQAALLEAERLGRQLTNEYLSQADSRVEANRIAAMEIVAAAKEEASTRMQASKMAAQSVVADVLEMRNKSINAYEELRKKSEQSLGAAFDFSKTSGSSEKGSPKGLGKELDKLLSKVDKFGDSWTRTGNIIADTFGDAADKMSSFAAEMNGITALQDELNKKRLDGNITAKESMDIDKALAKLNEQSYNAQIGAVGQLAGLTASMFKENSKERKALHALEMGFTAAEIAIATEKAIVSAAAAVANQGQGDPYTAFGRIASMIAIMGGVLGAAGIAFSGGGGGSAPRATNTGTGTVFGSDEASSSISNSLEMFEDIQVDQLAELRGIRDSMTSLSSGIAQLAKSFIAGGGLSGFSGSLEGSSFSESSTGKLFSSLNPLSIVGVDMLGSLFGKTTKKIIDSGVSFISQSLGQILEQGTINARQFFDIEVKKSKLFGLSKSTKVKTEYQAIDAAFTQQIGAIFGSISDTVIGSIKSLGIDSVTMQQVISKELVGFNFKDLPIFEQVFGDVEVSLEDAIKKFRVNIGDISFEDMSGKEIQEQLEAVFSQQADLITEFLMPAITEYQKIGEGAFETLQRVTLEQAIFNDTVSAMGHNLSDLSAIMKIDVAQSILAMIGGLDKFKDLTGEYLDAFFTDQEKFDLLAGSLGDVFAQLNMQVPDTRQGFRDIIESLDLTTEEGQATFATLMQLVPAMDQYLKSLEQQTGAVLSASDAMSQAMSNINSAVEAEKSLLNSQRNLLVDNLSFAEQQLREAFNIEKTGIQEAANTRINALNAEKSIIGSSISNLLSIASKFNNANISVQDALNAARRGDFSLAQNLTAPQITDKGFGSAEEMAFAQARQRAQLSEIGGLASSRASVEQAMLRGIDAQIASTEKNAQEQIAKLDEQLAALLGIDNSVPSLEEAIKLYNQAQLDLDALNYDAEIERLDKIIADSEAQINALLGIDTSVMSVADAVNALAEKITQYTPPSETIRNDTSKREDEDRLHTEKTDAMNESMTRNMARMADTIDKIYRGEINVRQVN